MCSTVISLRSKRNIHFVTCQLRIINNNSDEIAVVEDDADSHDVGVDNDGGDYS